MAIPQILFNYLDLIGYALVTALLISFGISLLFPKQKLFNKKSYWGIFLVVLGLLFFIQKLFYLFSRM